jgi:iron-sulfur cluster repair protein YtfE (RIC family)
MAELTIEDPVPDWAIDYPESIAVFETYGIDYCCGGKSLAYVCEQRSLNPQMVLREIKDAMSVETI